MSEALTAEKAKGGESLPWSLRHVTVSEVFWRAVHERFPGLRKQPGYPALFWHLLFATWCDEETGRVLLCAPTVADMAGRTVPHAEVDSFLAQFSADVLPDGEFHWTRWTHGKCRQLKSLHLGQFEDCLAEELRGRWDDGGHVYLNGSKFTDKRQRARRQAQRHMANLLPAQCEIAARIRGYMNNLTPHLFTRTVRNNYFRAVKAATNLPVESTAKMQQRILRYIRAQPQPFYAPSPAGNTVRLFTRESIPNLQGEVRRALTRDWPEADLQCSQLAICAWLWHVPAVTQFLAGGENIWTYLCDASGIPMEQRALAKPIIKKRALYPICFGMEESHVRGLTTLEFLRVGIARETAGKLLTNPLLRALFSARDEAADRVNRDGGMNTCFGKPCSVTEEKPARNVLAEVAQAWEMKLIYPAFELAEENRAFTITLFQHDGFSVHFHERAELWKGRIEDSVNEAARQVGIKTNLQWKD